MFSILYFKRSHHQQGEVIADKYKIVGILGESNSGTSDRAIDYLQWQLNPDGTSLLTF